MIDSKYQIKREIAKRQCIDKSGIRTHAPFETRKYGSGKPEPCAIDQLGHLALLNRNFVNFYTYNLALTQGGKGKPSRVRY